MKKYNINLEGPALELLEYMAELCQKHFSAGWVENFEHILWFWCHPGEQSAKAKETMPIPSRLTELEEYRLIELSEIANGWACTPAEGTESDNPNVFGEFVPFLTLKGEIENWACGCGSNVSLLYQSSAFSMRHCFRCNRLIIHQLKSPEIITLNLTV